jgi:hypothetical protein
LNGVEAQEDTPIPEAHSGVRLLVAAYAAIWLIMAAFVALMWVKQRRTAHKLDALDRSIAKAAENPDDAEERMMKTVVKDHPRREQD